MKRFLPLALTLVFAFMFIFTLTLEATGGSLSGPSIPDDPELISPTCCTIVTWCGSTGSGSRGWRLGPNGWYWSWNCQFLAPGMDYYNPLCPYVSPDNCQPQ